MMRRSNVVRAAVAGRTNSTKDQWNAKYAKRELVQSLKHTGIKIIVGSTIVWSIIEYYVYVW